MLMVRPVGVVGIDIASLSSFYGVEALDRSGNNFGNMLFTNAAYKQIPNAQHLGFAFDGKKASETYSSIMIPAANWINAGEDWGFLADNLLDANLPVVMVGLGSQLANVSEVNKIPEGTIRFLKVVSDLSVSIAVRGQFTAAVLRELGITNVEVLGCPSMFYKGMVPSYRVGWRNCITSIGVGATRYVLPVGKELLQRDKQKELYQFALHNAQSIYFQSEFYEIGLLDREIDQAKNQAAMKYYGVSHFELLEQQLLKKGKYHTSLEHWINDVKKDDIYIGTRIHGVIAATLAGTPAVLIAHDKRTNELAETMAIPCIDIDDFEVSMLFDLDMFIDRFDFDKFYRRSDLNLKLWKKFYSVNKIAHNLGA